MRSFYANSLIRGFIAILFHFNLCKNVARLLLHTRYCLINIHLLGAIKLYAFYTSNTVQLLRSRNVERDSNFPSRFKCGVLISRDIEFSKCRALRTQVSSLSLQKTQAFTWSLLTLLTAQ